MERAVIEYLANAFWQVPVLAGGPWVLLRMVRPGPVAQHRVWLAALGLALLLPLYGAFYDAGPGAGADDLVAVQPARGQTHADAFSADAFSDSVGEPGGLVLGSHLAAAGPSFSWLPRPLHVRKVRLNAVVAHWILGTYLLVVLLGLFRILRAWRAARRLVWDSREIAMSDRASDAVRDCSRRFGVKTPQIRESSGIRGPVVVGAAAPVLLWPENFASHAEDEMMAALCHEIAHISRRDYFVNLLCEAAAVPLKWHPATYGVERRIRSTREMVCDVKAAEAMKSEVVYATCLVSLAQSMIGGGELVERAAAPGLFSSNVLEERVMRLMQRATAMSVRERVARGVAGAASMVATIGLAVVFHVVPAMAYCQTATPLAQMAKPAAPVAPVAPAVPAAPVAPAAAVAPTGHVAPATPATPAAAAPVAPVAPAAVVAPEKGNCHVRFGTSADGKPVVIIDGQERQLTPEEQQKLKKQLADAHQKLAADMARINSPEFRKQIEDAQRQATQEAAKINSGEFQKEMADAQRRVADATAKVNSPEFRKQIEDAQRQAAKIDSAQIQEQVADTQKRVADATAMINSPEFRKQIEDAQKQAAEAAAKVNSGEIQKQMAEAQKQIADALAKMKADQSGAK